MGSQPSKHKGNNNNVVAIATATGRVTSPSPPREEEQEEGQEEEGADAETTIAPSIVDEISNWQARHQQRPQQQPQMGDEGNDQKDKTRRAALSSSPDKKQADEDQTGSNDDSAAKEIRKATILQITASVTTPNNDDDATTLRDKTIRTITQDKEGVDNGIIMKEKNENNGKKSPKTTKVGDDDEDVILKRMDGDIVAKKRTTTTKRVTTMEDNSIKKRTTAGKGTSKEDLEVEEQITPILQLEGMNSMDIRNFTGRRQQQQQRHHQQGQSQPGAIAVYGDGEIHQDSSTTSHSQTSGAYASGIYDDEDNLLVGGGDTTTADIDKSDAFVSTTPYEAELHDASELFERQLQQRMLDRTVDALLVERVDDNTANNDNVGKGTSSSSTPSRPSNKWWIRLGLVGIGLICLLVTLVVIFLNNDDDGDATSSGSDNTKTNMEQNKERLMDILLPISGEDVLLDETSSQFMALSWLINEDEIEFNERLDSKLLIERYVIVLLYYATNGPNWYYQQNFLNSTSSVCNWNDNVEGILCNDAGYITQIDLDVNNLNGTLPKELSTLTNLERISINDSNLSGTIPESLGGTILSNLRIINFGSGGLTGTIPESFTQLRKLQTLWLLFNELTGTIPNDLFQQKTSLEYISLGGNLLSGTIPQFDPALTQDETIGFWEIDLSDNMLTSTIPESMYIPSLELIELWFNGLTGTLSEVGMSRLTQILYLDVDSNELSGTIPTTIGDLRDIEGILLSYNFLSGAIPSEIGYLDRLGFLWMNHNYLSGTIPVELLDLTFTQSIRLEINSLTDNLTVYCDQHLQPSSVLSGNNMVIFTSLQTDCAGLDPLVLCPCCTRCCDNGTPTNDNTTLANDDDAAAAAELSFVEDDDAVVDDDSYFAEDVCYANLDSACTIESYQVLHPEGFNYVSSAGTACNCINDGDSNTTTLSCMDPSCTICNRDGTICAINYEYQTILDDSALAIAYQTIFHYVVGRNDTVQFNSYLQFPDLNWECTVMVNNEVCNSCVNVFCENGFTGYSVNCDNLLIQNEEGTSANAETSGSVKLKLCEDDGSYDVQSVGPLAIFAFQDPIFRVGCPPRLYPIL